MSEPIVDHSKVSIKRGTYGTASYTNLLDQSLIAVTRDIKRGLSGRMYPLDKEGISRKIPNSDYHVSRKIDGEFTVMFKYDDEVFTLNPGGTVRVGLPWMAEAASLLKKSKVQNGVFVGELYLRKPQGERSRVHDIVSAARNPRSDEELSQIAFAVFDIHSLNDELCDTDDFVQIWAHIEKHVTGDLFHPVETRQVTAAPEIQRIFEDWVEGERAEGLIVRSDNGGFFKVKPRHTIDTVVMGFTESTGEREGMLHDILVGLKRADGSLQVLTKVGGGFTDDQRREILSDLKDHIVESEYAEVNSDHVAYQMVQPTKVAEISLLDLVSETTRGGPVNRMVLDFEDEYKVIRRFPLASVISPQFIRFRDDKSVDPRDVGIEQISKIVSVANFDQNAKELVFPKSEVLSRSVYTKTARGATMVRKFVTIKTNKEQQSEEFPAFVFHYTDFSPNRKSPLSREVRVSSSLAQITLIRDEFIKDNIKKGWEPVGTTADRAADAAVAASTATAEDPKSETNKAMTTKAKTAKAKTTETTETQTAPPKKTAKKKTVKKKTTKKKTVKKKTVKKTPQKKSTRKEAD